MSPEGRNVHWSNVLVSRFFPLLVTQAQVKLAKTKPNNKKGIYCFTHKKAYQQG